MKRIVLFMVCIFLLPAIFAEASSKEKNGLLIKAAERGNLADVQDELNDEADVKQATSGDQRITALGQFLRKTSIDEFPQFFNVFLGQMSIVGPRPHMLKHTDQYSKLIEYYRERHYVKPGITGWAQVSGYRGETDQLWKMEKRVEYDMFYLENWTFWWDIKIIIMTVFGKNIFKKVP